MADNDHVALLKQGMEAWNKWREENPGIKPDLGGANLTEARPVEGGPDRGKAERNRVREYQSLRREGIGHRGDA